MRIHEQEAACLIQRARPWEFEEPLRRQSLRDSSSTYANPRTKIYTRSVLATRNRNRWLSAMDCTRGLPRGGPRVTPVDPAGGYRYQSTTKTCKSYAAALQRGERLSNAYLTYPMEAYNAGKLAVMRRKKGCLERRLFDKGCEMQQFRRRMGVRPIRLLAR